MKNSVIKLGVILILLVSCENEKKDPFLISDSSVGPLTKEIQVRQLDSIFEKDSVVITKSTGMFKDGNDIFIYDSNGAKLLRLDPVQDYDSTSTIGNIQIIDPRFKTKEGLNTESTFKDIMANYHVSRTEKTLNAVVVFIDEINAYVTIDKEELPAELLDDMSGNITASQIPSTAKIHYFWIGWQ